MISNQNMCIQTRRKIIMKKKLFGLLAAVMAVSMTTSAFAADLAAAKAPRDAFDKDGSKVFTANDVYLYSKDPVDVNADTKTDNADVSVLYSLGLQPNTVTAKAFVFAQANGTVNVNTRDITNQIIPLEHLGYTVVEDEYGTGVLKEGTPATLKTISDDIYNYVAGDAARAEQVSTQLNKIFFNNAVKGDVYLRSNNGWAMLCYALRYIVPMKESDAVLCNKVAQLQAEGYTFAADGDAQVAALDAIKAVVVGNQTDNAKANETPFTTADITTIHDNVYTAFPTAALTSDNITKTAEEVLKITDTKYDVVVYYNGKEEVLSADTAKTSEFIAAIAQLGDYENKTIKDVTDALGDAVTVTAGRNEAMVGIAYGLDFKASAN